MFNFEKYQEIKRNIDYLDIKTEIIAISKTHPLESVETAILSGLQIFGENRVQEARLKFEELISQNKSLQLHLTGPLQTNKVKQALNLFNVFHTLDREKLLIELSKYPEKIKNKSFFIQVNTGKELSKSGIYPEDVNFFFNQCVAHGLNNILGLMCIPPINENPKNIFK